jgi:hypothetical protein
MHTNITKLPNNQYSASIVCSNASASHRGFNTITDAQAWIEVMKDKVHPVLASSDDIFRYPQRTHHYSGSREANG